MSKDKKQSEEIKEPFIEPDQLTNCTQDGRQLTLKDVNNLGMLSYTQVAALISWDKDDHSDKETYIHRCCYAWNVPLQGNGKGFCYADSINAFLVTQKPADQYEYWVGDQIYFSTKMKVNCQKCSHENDLIITHKGGDFFCDKCKSPLTSIGHADPCGMEGEPGIIKGADGIINAVELHDELYALRPGPDPVDIPLIREKKKKLPRKVRKFAGYN